MQWTYRVVTVHVGRDNFIKYPKISAKTHKNTSNNQPYHDERYRHVSHWQSYASITQRSRLNKMGIDGVHKCGAHMHNVSLPGLMHLFRNAGTNAENSYLTSVFIDVNWLCIKN